MSNLLASLLTSTVSPLVVLVATTAGAAVLTPACEAPAMALTTCAPRPLVAIRIARPGGALDRVLYMPAAIPADLGNVLPSTLTAPGSLLPTGSLSWAGIHEADVIARLPQPNPKGGAAAGRRDVASDAAPDLELLTANPAPEPPAVMLAGLALAAGGLVWTNRRRRTPSERASPSEAGGR